VVNPCAYCTGLHGELARMAGTDPDTYQSPCVAFAKTFASASGRSAAVDAAYVELVASEGAARARSTQALCWMLLWGKTTGNTINAARDAVLTLKLKTLRPIDFVVVAFYGPLFAVIAFLNAALTKLPPLPPKASAAIGALLWFPQALHIGAMGVVCAPFKLVGLICGVL
jgi:hypothetical protein